jgi:hypothetical protein
MELGNNLQQLECGAAVRGWRAWAVVDSADGLRLASPLYDHIWLPGEPAHATCRRADDPFATRLPAHDVCSGECACGFHAVRDPVDAFSYLRGRDEPGTICRILGEVTLWGTVLAGPHGWRAASAYPARLYTSDAALAAALQSYGAAVSSAQCASGSATSSTAASGGPSTSSCSAPRMQSSSTRRSG